MPLFDQALCSRRLIAAAALMLIALLGLTSSAPACPYCEKGREKYQATTPVLVEGMGGYHHPVSTKISEAQCYFDQGLAYCYAFNHDEAIRSFRHAAELDTSLAMAWWGVAYALGTNYNIPTDSTRMQHSWEAVQEARKRLGGASPAERLYVEAIAARVSDTWDANGVKRLDSTYSVAMGKLAAAYPDDLDAQTLYGESLMNLRPWQLYSITGEPAPQTKQIEQIFEGVLRRNPEHPGAHHFNIHTVEGSPNPERGLMSAFQLPPLMPAAGHLVHMPAHIFIRTGDYLAAVEANRRAIEIDSVYVANNGGQGFYSLLYVPHNIHFYAIACAMAGMESEALRSVTKLDDYIAPSVKLDAMIEGVSPTHLLLLTKFRKWDAIRSYPAPDSSLHVLTSVWHFAQGMAAAAAGELKEAQRHLDLFRAEQPKLLPNAMMGTINPANLVLPIAEQRLLAAMEESKGKKGNPVPYFEKAISLQTGVIYDEPEAWYLSSREALGGYYLRQNQPQKAEEVFRADLKQYPRNGRSLYGLVESLKMQGHTEAASEVELEFESSWKKADVKLSVAGL